MSDHQYLLDLANDSIEKGDYKFAIVCYNKAILECQYDYDEKARITLMEGKAYLAIGNNEKAIEDFNYAAEKGNKEAIEILKKLSINNTPQKPASSSSTTAPKPSTPSGGSTPVKPVSPSSGSTAPAPVVSGRKITYPNGDKYEGDIVSNIPQGKGKMKYKTGDVYEGDFSNGVPHGKGIKKFKDGGVINGNFVNGKPVPGSPNTNTQGGSFSILEMIKNSKK